MKKFKIKKGDTVIVITGKDKGKTGNVIKVDKDADTILIDGINMRKKHIKPNPPKSSGGVVDVAMPIHISNASLIDPNTSKAAKVGYKANDKKNKVRFFKKSGEVLK